MQQSITIREKSQGAYYSDPIESWAESAWRNHKLVLSPPADLSAVAAYLGIRLVRRTMTTPAMLGAYFITPAGKPVIVVNKCIELITRQRWTIAHEIGHHLLRQPGEIGRICVLGIPELEADPPTERRADRFAAALLMPYWLVQEWFNDLSSNPTGHIAIMADRFGVSLLAMKYRLKELRLGKGIFLRKRLSL